MKILLHYTVLALLFFTVPLETNAQEAMNFSLKEAQDHALLNSTQLKNAEIDLQLAKKKIWETTAIGLPQVSGKASYQHIFELPLLVIPEMPSIPLGVKDNTTVDLTVSQLVFSGEYLVGLRASRVFYLISDQAKEKTIYDTRESVANTYTLVLMLQSNLDVMNQSLDNLNAMFNEMREMNKQGFVELTDVDQIELTTLTLQNGISSMERQIKGATDLLKFQIGYPIDKEINLTDNLEAMAGDVNLETLVSNGFKVENNINYKIMDTQVKLNKLNLQRERSTYLPSLAAVYNHHRNFDDKALDFNPRDLFMLSLTVPIFSSGQRYVKVQQRSLEYDKAVNNKNNATQGLQLEYINARNEMLNAYETFNNVKKNLELTNRIYDKTLIKFREGLSTSMDLTQAQNQLLSAQSEYINNMNALLSAKNKMTKLTTIQ